MAVLAELVNKPISFSDQQIVSAVNVVILNYRSTTLYCRQHISSKKLKPNNVWRQVFYPHAKTEFRPQELYVSMNQSTGNNLVHCQQKCSSVLRRHHRGALWKLISPATTGYLHPISNCPWIGSATWLAKAKQKLTRTFYETLNLKPAKLAWRYKTTTTDLLTKLRASLTSTCGIKSWCAQRKTFILDTASRWTITQ